MGLLVGTVLYPIISATKRHKIIVWICRLAAIPLAVILFVTLIRNFYKSDPYAGKGFKSRFNIISLILSFPQLARGVATCHVSRRMPITIAKGALSIRIHVVTGRLIVLSLPEPR